MIIKVRGKIFSSLFLLACSLLFSCQSNMTPLQVSEMFWQGVQTQDVAKIKKHSMRNSLDGIDAINDLTQIEDITFGKIIIDGDNAEIETKLILAAETQANQIPLKTYLEAKDKVWRVNYKKTISPLLINHDMTELLGGIQELTEEFAKEIEGSVEEFKEKALPEIKSQLEQAEEEIREQLPELKNMIKEFLQDLQDSIEKAIPAEEENQTQKT